MGGCCIKSYDPAEQIGIEGVYRRSGSEASERSLLSFQGAHNDSSSANTSY